MPSMELKFKNVTRDKLPGVRLRDSSSLLRVPTTRCIPVVPPHLLCGRDEFTHSGLQRKQQRLHLELKSLPPPQWRWPIKLPSTMASGVLLQFTTKMTSLHANSPQMQSFYWSPQPLPINGLVFVQKHIYAKYGFSSLKKWWNFQRKERTGIMNGSTNLTLNVSFLTQKLNFNNYYPSTFF